MASTVRVRFAPSPTGALHIGGARTALFNWLFARHHGGRFLLRIEDTDAERSSPELTDQILRSLRWLGLKWDEDIVFQSGRRSDHARLCETLLETGAGYRCFCPPDVLSEKRRIQESATGGYRYDRTCLKLDEADIQKRLQQEIPFAVRFRVPEGETAFEDLVHGRIVFRHTELDDFVLLRSDGSPVYQVAVVSDDHDMGITHVIRGDDHLSNTPKQILLYRAMGWDIPRFAHVPMIWGPDRKRLSKRHGAVSVEAYREAGYLPETLVNFLALLGWSPGDDREILSFPEIVRSFSIPGISKNPAVFDEKKLEWMNGQYVRSLPLPELLDRVLPFLRNAGLVQEDDPGFSEEFLLRFVVMLRERVRRLTDFAETGAYFFRDPESFDETAVEKFRRNLRTGALMEALLQNLSRTEDWTDETLEAVVRESAATLDVRAGDLIHPLRLVLTGQTASPGLFELMAVLGQETVLRRLKRTLALWTPNHP
ncbi:MAG TPA: glutamate--tRNA ligase [bacterium]|nr:glutamate--tRNA ligase [bacterium]